MLIRDEDEYWLCVIYRKDEDQVHEEHEQPASIYILRERTMRKYEYA
jgi:hypothetical protein